jgi:acyl-coenzyme A thioesterase PaaI-like protein
VVVDAQTVRVGNNLAFLTVKVTKNDNDLIAHGGHTKHIAKYNKVIDI